MRVITGKIVSNAMQKTLVVQVDSYRQHPKYLKKYCVSKKFYVHTEDQSKFSLGDVIDIQETRPLSKLKRWCVVSEVQESSI